MWALLPHIVSVVNGTAQGNAFAKVNAFVVPLNDSSAVGNIALIIPVVMATPANGTVAVNVTRADRVWSGGENGGPYRHPAVVQRAAPLLQSVPNSTEYEYSAQWAGGGGAWQTLLVTAEASAVVYVPMQPGCAGAAVLRVVQRLVP